MRPWICIAFLTLFALQSNSSPAAASETGWSPIIIPRGEYREQIKSTPIEMRPNRPLHFYGNTVRRNYYRAPVLTAPTILAPAPVLAPAPLRRSVLLRY